MYTFDKSKPIAIGCDHAGFDCKEDLISFLEGEQITKILLITPILRTLLQLPLKAEELHLEFYYAEAQTVLPLLPINTRE